MRKAGLDVRIDAAANVIGRREGTDSGPAILFGSHIDTVPDGGSYDGILGSLAGIECLETMEEAGLRTLHPLEVVVFANEEGQSFGGMSGSRAMIGALESDELGQRDASGRSLAEALAQFGGNPDRIDEGVRTSDDVRAYVELHVEQGAVLENERMPIGGVEGIVGIRYVDVRVSGNANHAGTTPMNLRCDALVAASRFVSLVDEELRTGNFCRVGTVGQLEVEPNARNVVPGRVRMTLGLRDLDTEEIDRTLAHLREGAKAIGEPIGVDFRMEEVEIIDPAVADPAIMSAVKSAAETLGLRYHTMPSGAGHDAQMMARIAPMGMIFVPSAQGVSHSSREFTSPEDCANGTNVLFQTIFTIDRSEAQMATAP